MSKETGRDDCILLVAVGCGSVGAKPAFTPPKGATEVETGVWAFEGMLYGGDCDRLRVLTKEGEKYGPTGNYQDGTAKAGFGYVCP